MVEVYKAYYKSPVGLIEITGAGDAITYLYFVDERSGDSESNVYLDNCIAQLDEYFCGKRKEFALKLCPEGTEFQKKVWNKLLEVAFGNTLSYNKLAGLLGNVKTIRAVANANARNKISIIIPCHRIIGSNGSLTGYGGGLWRKKWLLEHERKYSNVEAQLRLF